MPFERPTLTELQDSASAELAGRLGLGALKRRGVLLPLSQLVAGARHSLHGHLDWLHRNFLVVTADSTELDRLGADWRTARKPATFATGDADATGTNGTIVPVGTEFTRDDGVKYLTTTLQTIAAGVAVLDLDAKEAGEPGNAAVGEGLNPTSPITGLDSPITVKDDGSGGGITKGEDIETDTNYRLRIQDVKSAPKSGGAEADWIRWAREIAGVTRAFAIPHYQGSENTIGLTFAVDEDDDGPIPSASKVAEVQTRLEDPVRKPITSEILVFAPVEKLLSPTIRIDPNTDAVRKAVTASIEDLLLRTAQPGTTLPRSHITEAISNAPGENDHLLDVPTGDVVIASNELLTIGTVTFLSL